MNITTLEILSQCIDDCEQLGYLLEQDVAHMELCVTGEVLKQYRLLIDETRAKVTHLKDELYNQYDATMSIM